MANCIKLKLSGLDEGDVQLTYRVNTITTVCNSMKVKFSLCSDLGKVWGLSAPLVLISARFERDSVIYCDFC